MPKYLPFIFVGLMVYWFNVLMVSPVSAGTAPVSETATVSATVNPQHVAGATAPPTIPILYQPEDGTITNNNRRDFVWYQSTDPNGNTITYTLYLNGVATYLGISNLGNSAGGGYSSQLDGQFVKLHPTVSLSDGTYDWYVTATDLAGNSSHSTTWRLTIDTSTPTILVTDIDIYHNLHLDSSNPSSVPPGLNFDIAGPTDVYFTINTKRYSSLTLQFFDSSNQQVAQSIWQSDESGTVHPYQHLSPGVYTVQISVVDQAGQAGALPTFTLTVHQAQVSLPLPPIPGLPTTYNVPYTPFTVTSFPATIASLQTPGSLSTLIGISLAIGIIWLLIFFWKRRSNILIIDPSGTAIPTATIYHSIPTTRTHFSPVFMTHRPPVTYYLVPRHHGYLYISGLTRYSTLTIRIKDETYILSLSAKRSLYTLILG
jgi:hypothetical protein